MVVEVLGFNLPGRSCHPAAGAGPYENVHVGIGPRDAPVELFAGDAAGARWTFEVRPVELPDGSLDYRGPLVAGRRGDRFLYLNWGTVGDGGEFRLFRRAKVDLSPLDPGLVRSALDRGQRLVTALDLTDPRGNPTCARFRPPNIAWRVEA